MGNSLRSVSPTCLPCPKGSTRDELEKKGITFSPTEDRFMCNCVLPDGFGLLLESDRGDMRYYSLLDDSATVIATIFWMSKGYENEARISVSGDETKKLDVNKCKLENEWWKVLQSKEREKFDRLYREYLIMPSYGSHASTIKERYELLKNLNRGYLKEIPQLTAHEGGERDRDAILNVNAGTISYSGHITTEIPWLN